LSAGRDKLKDRLKTGDNARLHELLTEDPLRPDPALYAVTDSRTLIVLDRGKVTATDGRSAVGKIAKDVIARLATLRQSDDPKKPN
jgi:hypothetical protein